MAQQATVKRAAKSTETPVKMGRPPGSRNKTGEERRLTGKRKVFDYLRWKLSFQKPADFYLYLEGYPDKTGLMAYVYRLKPRIDLSMIGIDETAIHTTMAESEMTEDFIGATFGRGLYMLTLNDANRPKGQTEVCRTWFDCATAQKPPQYDPRTLCLAEPKNLDEVNRLLNMGVLVRDNGTAAPRLRTEQDGAPAPIAAAAPAASGELFGRDFQRELLMGLITQRSANPHDTVKDTIEIARMLIPAAPAVDLESMVERVVAKLKGNGGGRELDAFANYERMETFIGKFRGPVAAVAGAVEGGDAGASWAPHLPGILIQARAMIPELVGAFRMLKAETNGHQNGAGQQNGGQRPMTIEERIEAVLREGYQRMNEGVKGFDFAAYVCNFVDGGLDVYKTIEPMGAVGLIALGAMKPETRALVNDPKIRPQLEAFLEDFFSFDPDVPSGELPPPGSASASA